MIHPKNHHKRFARLACVKHAASVHPEPGSNSLKKFVQDQNLAWLIFYPVLFTLVLFFKNYILLNFQGYVTVQLSRFFLCCHLSSNFFIISGFVLFVKNFFNFFQKFFWSSFVTHSASIDFITVFRCCQQLFSTFFNFLNFLFFSVYSEKIRRRRDLNPRTAWTVYTLSRGASSATWVLLQIQMHSVLNSVHQWRIWNYTLWIYFCQCFF